MDNSYGNASALRRRAAEFKLMGRRARDDADSFSARGYVVLALASEQRACSLECQAEQLHTQAAKLAVHHGHPQFVPNYAHPKGGW